MFAAFQRFLDWIRSLFWSQEMEICLVGLQFAGKTTLINVMAAGQFKEDMIPTVGFNMRKVTKGGVAIKIWDIGGQPRFRPMWERYCRGVNAILFMVDSADREHIAEAKAELHGLLGRPQLDNIPVLVLGNKKDLPGAMDTKELIEKLLKDLPGAMDTKELIEKLALGDFAQRSICCYSISCKEKFNIGITLEWLIQHKTKRN